MVNASIAMPAALVDRLDAYAYDNRVSRAEAARLLITAGLDKAAANGNQLPGQTAIGDTP